MIWNKTRSCKEVVEHMKHRKKPVKQLLSFGLMISLTLLTSCSLDGKTHWAEGYLEKTGAMNYPRAGAKAILLKDDRVLVCGGGAKDFPQYKGECEIYDPRSGVFSLVQGTDPSRGFDPWVLLPDGRVWVLNHRWIGDDLHKIYDSEIFDPTTGQWSIGPLLPDQLDYYLATDLPDGNVLIMGGVKTIKDRGLENIVKVKTTYIYNVKSGHYQRISDMNFPHSAYSGFPTYTIPLKNGDILIFDGDHNERYSYKEHKFILLRAMNIPRRQAGTTLLDDGSVLISVGIGLNSQFLDKWVPEMEKFDPKTNHFISFGNSPQESSDTILLPNGKILINGAYTYDQLIPVMLYDPKTQVFTKLGYLPQIRVPTLVHLKNGKILFISDSYKTHGRFPADVYVPEGVKK